MSAPLRRKPPLPEPAAGRRSVADFVSTRRAGLGALLVLAGAIVAAGLLWRRLGEQVTWGEGGLLKPEMIELRGVSPWVKSDLKAEALRAASLDGGLPLADPELPNRIARAFDTHPWVRRVVGVELKHPPAAVVEVLCREPVAMVAVQGGLLAVDAEGVVLPSGDFTAEAAAEYPRIMGVGSSPQGPEGSPWGDAAVEEGAALAAVIGPEWRSLGLVECRPTTSGGARTWNLIGPEGRKIVFGSAPGRERAGEASAAAKVARLRKLADDKPTTDAVDLTTVSDAPRSIPTP